MLVLPRLRILVEELKQELGDANKDVDWDSDSKDYGEELHYGKLVLLTLHLQVGESADERGDCPNEEDDLEQALGHVEHDFDGFRQWLVLVNVKSCPVDRCCDEVEEG